MIVLDTHALIWWASDDRQLSAAARKAIEAEQAQEGQILISAISAWEIAMLVSSGRLALAMDVDEWLAMVEALPAVAWAPVSTRLAVQSVRLPGVFHKDPADRLIVALAREYNAQLVTADRRIQDYPHVRWVW